MLTLTQIILLLQAVSAMLGSLQDNPNTTPQQWLQANAVVSSVVQFVNENKPTDPQVNAPSPVVIPPLNASSTPPVQQPVVPPVLPPVVQPTSSVVLGVVPQPKYTVEVVSFVRNSVYSATNPNVPSDSTGGHLLFKILDKSGKQITDKYDFITFKGSYKKDVINPPYGCGSHTYSDFFDFYYMGNDKDSNGNLMDPGIVVEDGKITLQLKVCGENIETKLDATN